MIDHGHARLPLADGRAITCPVCHPDAYGATDEEIARWRALLGPVDTHWCRSHRADKRALPLADRHYNRQHVGAPQFVPPGRCLVLLSVDETALWVTSWPFAQYVKHAWGGAWICSLFRNEGTTLSSTLVTEAVSATVAEWGSAPDLGMITFIDADKTRRKRDPGRCYRRAGWDHVGFTKKGLWVLQLPPDRMPPPVAAQRR